MRALANLGELAAVFMRAVAALPDAEHRGLEHGAAIIEAEAKHEIGTYQDAAGPFEEWKPLTDATLQGFELTSGKYIPGKEELGYAPPDHPLLRDGQLRDAITHSVEGRIALVGVPSQTVSIPGDGRSVDIGQVAEWQEFGHMGPYPSPPRSFLGGAAVRKGEEAANAVGREVAHAIAGLPPPIIAP